jgi:hypothetical protein
MRFGLFVPQGWRHDLVGIEPADQWGVMKGLAQHADAGPWESIWVYDHFHTTPEPSEEATHEVGDSAIAIAYQWHEAGEDERALSYLLAAADQAGRGWAKKRAVYLYQEAAKLVPEEDKGRRREIRLRQAVAMDRAVPAERPPSVAAAVPELDGPVVPDRHALGVGGYVPVPLDEGRVAKSVVDERVEGAGTRTHPASPARSRLG